MLGETNISQNNVLEAKDLILLHCSVSFATDLRDSRSRTKLRTVEYDSVKCISHTLEVLTSMNMFPLLSFPYTELFRTATFTDLVNRCEL